MADYELTFQTVSIPTGSGGASVTIEEDSNSDGTTDTSETIGLSDGVTSYTTSSGAFAGTGQVRLSWSLGPPSDVTTTSATVVPASVTVSETIPTAPSNLTATQGIEDRLNLTWTDNSNDEDEFRVYVSQSSGTTLADYTLDLDLPANTTSYTDTLLDDGTRYHYRVTAANTAGESSPTDEDSAVTVLPAASSLAATDVRATEVDLSWVVNSDSGSQSVEYKESSASTWTTYSSGLSSSTTSETVSGLSDGVSYDFRVGVTTVDAGTVYSGTVSATTLDVPDSPTGLTVTSVTSTPDVGLSWDNQSGEDEYRIYRATSPGTVLGDYTLLDTVTVDTTTYTDSTVSLGTRYYYVVTAANTNGESPPSGEVRAEPNNNDLTESISWDVDREFLYGTFSDTQTTGSGGVELDAFETVDFDYSLSSANSTDSASIEIRDASSGTILFSDIVSGAGASTSGTTTIDTSTHPDLEFYADINASGKTCSASITDEYGYTVVSVSGTSDASETVQQDYRYPESGTYTTEEWDYTNITTVSKFSYDCTIPSGDSLSFEIRDDAGTTLTTISASTGANSTLVSVPADDRYSVYASLSNAADTYDSTPVIHSLTLEAHTQPTGLALSNTTSTSVDIDWTPVSVADSHELYRSETTPVTDTDTLVAETNTPPVTDSGLENGEQYYYSVRAEYTGE